jgi:hypothetical protein
MITIERIIELQKEYGLTNVQTLIDSGQIWKFEGSVGRSTSDMLEAGILFLGEERTSDYYGNTIPARTDLKDGTKGTLGNAQRFWELVENGDANATEYAEQYREFMNYGFNGIK